MNSVQLPIYEVKDQILATLRNENRVVLSAPTGSGKTTQVPQILHHGQLIDGEIIILQPRRLAARLVAQRVAQEMNVELGQLVGYQTRFENRAGPHTRIRFLTEGLFLRHLQSNPSLKGIGAVILDEFHERNLATDVSAAMLKLLQEATRPDLRLIVMSATLDTKKVGDYLACPAIESHGRTYPVQIRHLEKSINADPWDLAADALAELLDRREEGDVLIFMPGGYEIRRTIEAVARHDRPAEPLAIFPLYSELPPREQDKAIAAHPHRKVIVSTNVAETSITIPGIRHVIDSGLARVNRFDPRRGINALLIEPISRASADQRSGRAGRTAPGTATRLWTEADHRRRSPHETPEVQRLDLAEVILQLKSFGVADITHFPWLEPPTALAIDQALGVLREIDAIDPQGHLTETGRKMSRLPMHPRLSRMMIEASSRRCAERAALWAALISERDILLRGQKHPFADDLPPGPRSDFLVLENAFNTALSVRFEPARCAAKSLSAVACREVARTADLYLQSVARINPESLSSAADTNGVDDLIKSLLTAFPDHLAILRNSTNLACALSANRRGTLDRESVVRREGLVLPIEIREIGAGGAAAASVKIALSLASEIELDWLYETHADRIESRRETTFNAETLAVETADRDYFEGLIVSEKILHEADVSAAPEIFADLILKGDLKLEKWDEAVEQWIARVRCVAQWFPDRKLITYEPDDLRLVIQEICAGTTRWRQIQSRDCLDHVKNALSWEDQRFVEQMAPDRILLPRGWRMKVEYSPGQPPRGRAKIQDFFGLDQTPILAAGRIKLLLEILAPNFRAVQITDDLSNFWKTLYPTLKKELSRRYPRHKWE